MGPHWPGVLGDTHPEDLRTQRQAEPEHCSPQHLRSRMVHLQQKLIEAKPIAGRTWCSGVDSESHMVTSTNNKQTRSHPQKVQKTNCNGKCHHLVCTEPGDKSALLQGCSGREWAGVLASSAARPVFSLHFKSESHHEVPLMGLGSSRRNEWESVRKAPCRMNGQQLQPRLRSGSWPTMVLQQGHDANINWLSNWSSNL